jgi:AcrR family transcriptional regulator
MARLTPTGIVDAALAVVAEEGPEALTMRRLGSELEADPTAVYRHFATMNDLLIAVGDRVLDGVCRRLPAGPPERVITMLCERVRAQAMARPRVASLLQAAPSLRGNERAVTERLIVELQRLGLEGLAAADGYHALIELTIGSAAIDAPLAAADPADRRRTYESWRHSYAAAAATHPASAALARHLYRGDADERFRTALRAMLRGLQANAQ